MKTFSFCYARINGIDADLPWPKLLSQHTRDRLYCSFRRRVDHGCRRRDGSYRRAYIDDTATVGPEIFQRLTRSQNQAEDIDTEVPLKLLFCRFVERCEFVNTGIVDQNIEPTKCLLCF